MITTRADLLAALAAIRRALDARTHVWRTVVDAKGNVIKRIYCGAYTDAPNGRGTTPPSGRAT